MSLNILYIRKALSKNGVEIKVPKIRTMFVGAEDQLEDVIANGIDELGKIRNDSRITRFGRFLRRYGIDEILKLPYNVIYKRNMSLVGIRPKPEKEWARFPKEHKEHALKRKPGFIGAVYRYAPFKSFEDFVQAESTYLDQRKISPYKTDFKHSFIIAYKVIFEGLRSR